MPVLVEQTEEPLVARGGLGIPQAVDKELPLPGSGRGYKPSQFVMPVPLMFHYRAIATNREEEAKEVVDLHNQRGEAENYFKELKAGFGMEWMPCGESYANAVFFRLGFLAYNLFLALKILGLPTEWRSYTIGTVRWRLYQVACRVVHHARRVVLKMAATMEKVALIRGVRRRCLEVAYNTS
ncbi:MAG: transposase [Dehalococcoidia bacterium]|nr:transposase [Dehalococcoidia bacterium]